MRKTANHQPGEGITIHGTGSGKTVTNGSWWVGVGRETWQRRVCAEVKRIDRNPISNQRVMQYRAETSV